MTWLWGVLVAGLWLVFFAWWIQRERRNTCTVCGGNGSGGRDRAGDLVPCGACNGTGIPVRKRLVSPDGWRKVTHADGVVSWTHPVYGPVCGTCFGQRVVVDAADGYKRHPCPSVRPRPPCGRWACPRTRTDDAADVWDVRVLQPIPGGHAFPR